MQTETSIHQLEPLPRLLDKMLVDRRYLRELERLAHLVALERKMASPIDHTPSTQGGPWSPRDADIRDAILRLHFLSP